MICFVLLFFWGAFSFLAVFIGFGFVRLFLWGPSFFSGLLFCYFFGVSFCFLAFLFCFRFVLLSFFWGGEGGRVRDLGFRLGFRVYSFLWGELFSFALLFFVLLLICFLGGCGGGARFRVQGLGFGV